MAAARWTLEAEDITAAPDTWNDHVSIEQLSDLIGLSPDTIMDTLTRTFDDPTDPRSAIVRPRYRIGPSRLNAIPRWNRGQVDAYERLALERAKATPHRADQRRELPTYTAQEAAKAGLAGTTELAELLGCQENTIRWWARSERGTFPPEVGIAARDDTKRFGPPRGLRSIAHVRTWINANPSRVKRLEQAQARKRAADQAARSTASAQRAS